MRCRRLSLVAPLAALAGFVGSAIAQDADVPAASENSRWLSDPAFFPIAVWLQSPSRAGEYKEAGFNLYVGLWRGPTEEQLADLKRQGMSVICAQNDVGLRHRDDPTILGWMHGDEPDNAQRRRNGRGYGPPIPPERIVEDYHRLKDRDPTRPVLLNLGQGVAWDGWHGRGVRTNHPEDYSQYVQGADIVSFDIYPAVHDHADVAGKLWLVAEGVTRLRKWSEDRRIVWNCIECTHISNPNAKATPQQVKAEVWMSLIRGSRGLIYFVHQFQPRFMEAALLADAEMLAQVRAVNRQIHELAPFLNSPTLPGAATVTSSSSEVPVEMMVKRHEESVYLFAVGMRDGTTTATFKIADLPPQARANVLGEDRQIEVHNGRFEDSFRPWDVHLYHIRAN